MAYKVNLTSPAEADAHRAFERIREVAPASADNWTWVVLVTVLPNGAAK